jgi:protein-tyrosine phosphatase
MDRQNVKDLKAIARNENDRRKISLMTDFCMDRQNVKDLKAIARNENDRRKISLMTDFCTTKKYDSVPDPYFGGSAGFELVLDILEDACDGLIQKVLQE